MFTWRRVRWVVSGIRARAVESPCFPTAPLKVQIMTQDCFFKCGGSTRVYVNAVLQMCCNKDNIHHTNKLSEFHAAG